MPHTHLPHKPFTRKPPVREREPEITRPPHSFHPDFWEPSVEPDYQSGFQRMVGGFREGGLQGLAASAKEEFSVFLEDNPVADESPGWGTLASVEGVLSPEEREAAERGAVRQVVDLLSLVPVFGKFVKPSYAIQTFGRDIAEGNYLSAAQNAAQLGGWFQDEARETGQPPILLPSGKGDELPGPLFRRHAALFQTAINSAEAAINEFFASKGPGIVQGDSPGPPYEGQILLPPPVPRPNLGPVYVELDEGFSTETRVEPYDIDPGKLVSDVPPIHRSFGGEPSSREDLINYVEEPLLAAAELMFDKNITLTGTSANAIGVGEPAGDPGTYNRRIWVEYTLLSDENKEIADNMVKAGHGTLSELESTSEDPWASQRQSLYLHMPIDETTTVGEVQDWSVGLANQFVPQTERYWGTEDEMYYGNEEQPWRIFEKGSGPWPD